MPNPRLRIARALATSAVTWVVLLGRGLEAQIPDPQPVVVPGPMVTDSRGLYLPRVPGPRVVSSAIYDQALYLDAQGRFLLSVALARKINAEAVEHELQNNLLRIDTYFQGRAKNRAYRKQENPDFLMREAKRQQVKRDKITKYFQFTLRGDETETLNWLLNELSGPLLALQSSPSSQWLLEEIQFPLAQEDIRHIRFTDRGSGGKEMVFRASDAEVLKTVWPWGLRGPEFDDARNRFETARDALVNQLAALEPDQQADSDMGQEAFQAINELLVMLEKVYPKDRRQDHKTFLEYNTSKRYVRSLLAAVCRALESNDRRLFDRSYRFEGKTVVDLLNHMYRGGLEFGRPEPGDEGTYEKLFIAMREVYLRSVDPTAIPGAER